MIILGIDPGIATTGYGVIECSVNKKTKNSRTGKKGVVYLKHGVILTSPSLKPAERLKQIHLELSKIIAKHKPEILGVESVFFFKNIKTAMPVSQARGVILLAAAQNKIPIEEITPLQVKMTIAGYGRADKKQVQKMIQILLNLEDIPKPDDAADALGVAICCALKNGYI